MVDVVGGKKLIRSAGWADGGVILGNEFYGGDVRPALVAAGFGSDIIFVGNIGDAKDIKIATSSSAADFSQ